MNKKAKSGAFLLAVLAIVLYVGFGIPYASAMYQSTIAPFVTSAATIGVLLSSEINNAFNAVGSTLAAAIASAGTTGSVVIPGSYTGTDTFSANSHGVHIDDQRPLSNALTPIRRVNAADFGAIADGAHDCTGAINAAIGASYAYNLPASAKEPVTVVLPQGTCLLTNTLTLGQYGSLVGESGNTFLVALYSSWVGSNKDAIEITINSALTGGASSGWRRISGFSLIGLNNSAIVSNGIHVTNSSNIYSPNSYALPNISIDHMLIQGFDTGIQAEDMLNAVIDSDNITSNRVAISLFGQVINVAISHSSLGYGTFASTSTTPGSSYGVFLGPNSKYTNGSCGSTLYCAPQGISIHDNNIVAANYLIYDQQVAAFTVHDNVLDYGGQSTGGSGSAGIYFGPVGIGGGVHVTNNYIASNTADGFGIYSASTGGSEGFNVGNNYFLNYQAPSTSNAIALAGSGGINQVHINGNVFYQWQQAVNIDQVMVDSDISGNSGSAISGYFINPNGTAGQAHVGLTIANNTDTDNVPVVNEGSSTGFITGYNRSPVQLTGTFQATGAGCTIAAGAIGNVCGVASTVNIANGGFPGTTTYTVNGCTIYGATGSDLVTPQVGVITLGGAFPVQEIALSTTATGGGTINCTVTQQ